MGELHIFGFRFFPEFLVKRLLAYLLVRCSPKSCSTNLLDILQLDNWRNMLLVGFLEFLQMGVPRFGMLDFFLSLFSCGTYTKGFHSKAVIFRNKTQLTFTKYLICKTILTLMVIVTLWFKHSVWGNIWYPPSLHWVWGNIWYPPSLARSVPGIVPPTPRSEFCRNQNLLPFLLSHLRHTQRWEGRQSYYSYSYIQLLWRCYRGRRVY